MWEEEGSEERFLNAIESIADALHGISDSPAIDRLDLVLKPFLDEGLTVNARVDIESLPVEVTPEMVQAAIKPKEA